MLESLNKGSSSLKRATFINAASKYTTVGMNLLFSAILARLLSPNDYGIVAVVTVITNFFIIFCDMGIGAAIIQNKKLTSDDENRIFAFSIYIGIGISILFSLCSAFLVKAYHNVAYYWITPLLGVSLFFSTINMVPNARLFKQKKFLIVAIRTILTTFASYLVATILAFLHFKYYSIVFQSIASSMFIFLWNYAALKQRADHHKVIQSVKIIWSYSFYQLAFNIVNYFARNLDNLLVGYCFGNSSLGYYDKAYKLSRYPIDNLTNTIVPSIQPILSDYQDRIKYVFKQYNKIVKMLAIIGVYLCIICFFASKELILLFFGKQWNGSIQIFHILSLSVPFQMVVGISGSIYQSVNKTKQMFWSGILGAVILVSSIIIGIIQGSLVHLSICLTIGFVINFFACQWFLGRYCFEESLWTVLKVYVSDAIIFVVLFAAMIFVPTFNNLLLSLFLKLCISFTLYTIMLLITKEYRSLLVIFPGKWREKMRENRALLSISGFLRR